MSSKYGLSWGDKDLRSVKSPEDLPEIFNFAAVMTDRHLAEGRGSNVALHGPAGKFTYDELAKLVNQTGNALLSLGIRREQRVLLLLRDSPEFIFTYLGAMKIGAIPIGLNTFALPSELEFYIRHSRARCVVGEGEFLQQIEQILRQNKLRAIIAVRGNGVDGAHDFQQLVSSQSPELDPAPTHKQDPSHWVYTSGSTGSPKAAVHLHKNTLFAIEPYINNVLRMVPEDIVFSVSRLFFSYGLGNSLFIPLWVGSGVVLMPMRPEPDRIFDFISQYKPTLFFCVPTGYGRLMRDDMDAKKLSSLRLCISAGEALPAQFFLEWKEKTGLEVIDGVGSTEFGYIFLTNRLGAIVPDSSGTVLPEHTSRLVKPDGTDADAGETGELWMSSPCTASYYWRNHEASKKTFYGEWLRTGDQYELSDQGTLSYHGRTDDLFKVGGIWVSPIQVESTLLSHPAVAEAAVVPHPDSQGLDKPAAFIVLKSGFSGDQKMADDLREFTRSQISHYKCPRQFHFVDDLPKTATGKIQRYKLRSQLASAD